MRSRIPTIPRVACRAHAMSSLCALWLVGFAHLLALTESRAGKEQMLSCAYACSPSAAHGSRRRQHRYIVRSFPVVASARARLLTWLLPCVGRDPREGGDSSRTFFSRSQLFSETWVNRTHHDQRRLRCDEPVPHATLVEGWWHVGWGCLQTSHDWLTTCMRGFMRGTCVSDCCLLGRRRRRADGVPSWSIRAFDGKRECAQDRAGWSKMFRIGSQASDACALQQQFAIDTVRRGRQDRRSPVNDAMG